jgi:hypothetical protein
MLTKYKNIGLIRNTVTGHCYLYQFVIFKGCENKTYFQLHIYHYSDCHNVNYFKYIHIGNRR